MSQSCYIKFIGSQEEGDDNLKKYSYTTTLLLTTFLYGIHMLTGRTFLRIVEPPMRHVLVAGMILIPILGVIFIAKKRIIPLKWVIISISSLWIMISTLYVIHPIQNGGWVLSGSLTLYALNILWRGDWRIP